MAIGRMRWISVRWIEDMAAEMLGAVLIPILEWGAWGQVVRFRASGDSNDGVGWSYGGMVD